METQTIINIVFAVAFVGYVVWQRNPTFNKITCKGWRVMDEGGTERITAFTTSAEVERDGGRVSVERDAGVVLNDQKGKLRIMAKTCDETAIVLWCDKNSLGRFWAATLPDGTVVLPTKDMCPPTKP